MYSEFYATTVRIALMFFFGSIAIEWIVSLLLRKGVYRPIDALSSISSGLSNNVKAILKLTVIIVTHDWMLKHLALFELPANATSYILCFLLFDFAYYWKHRFAHEINFLWNRHLIHHSSEEFNLAAAMRQPISGFVQLYFFLYIPIAVIGVPTIVVAVIAPLHRFAQFWYHTRLINRMGFLEKIIVTPSHHRVHHAINKEYLDKNYSAIFIFCDKLFGTFQEEMLDNPPVYGITKSVQTWNPFIINFMHLWSLTKDSWRTKKWSDKLKVWYKSTGWRPDDMQEKYPIEYTKDVHQQVKYETESTPFLTSWGFIQVFIHIAIQFHFLALLTQMSWWDLLYYGAFVGFSIFSYTSLLDRHWIAVPVEFIKTIFGFFILNYFGGWFLLNESYPISTFLIGIYFMVSLVITIYFTRNYFEKSSVKLEKTII